MRSALDLCPFGKSDGVGEVVPELPVPVVGGNLQQCLRLTVGKYQAVFEVLAAGVHVGMKRNQPYVSGDFEVGIDAVVWISGRNFESSIHGGERQHTFFRRFFREDYSHASAVGGGLSVGRVVHFEDDVGAGLDQLGLAGLQNFRILAGSVADQEVAG